jgi:hypothetical protein
LKNQVFHVKLENGKYSIISPLNGGVLEVPSLPNSATTNGLQMIFGQPNNADYQKWDLVPSTKAQFKGGYVLRTFGGKALDVAEGNTSNGTSILQWDHH